MRDALDDFGWRCARVLHTAAYLVFVTPVVLLARRGVAYG